MSGHHHRRARRRLQVLPIQALALAVLAGCASSAFEGPSLALDVQSAVASGNVNVHVIDGTAILTGRVRDRYDAQAAARAALRHDGVERVVDRLYIIGSGFW